MIGNTCVIGKGVYRFFSWGSKRILWRNNCDKTSFQVEKPPLFRMFITANSMYAVAAPGVRYYRFSVPDSKILFPLGFLVGMREGIV